MKHFSTKAIGSVIAKRKVERWRAKYAALPQEERLAIMVALNEVDSVN